MRTPRLLTALATLTLLATSAFSQTTAIPGFNDYTINGSVSGSTSCTSLTYLSPVTLNLQVAAAPGSNVFFLLSPGPCSPNALPLLTCQGTTLDIRPPFISLGSAPVAGGTASLPPIFIPPSLPFSFSTQAVIIDPSCVPFFLFTQAYDVLIL